MWYYNNYIAILILSVIFFLISNNDVKILLSILIIIIIGYYYFIKINEYNNINLSNKINIISSLNEDIKKRDYINTDNYLLKKIPEKIKYFHNDEKLLNIILNIRFIKKYDYEKYTNLLYYMDNLYKIYMFILSNRYDIKDYFSTFVSLRTTIIKELYSIYIILPMKMKYYYGFNSFDELKKSITEFIEYSRKLITILERYGQQEKNVYYLEDTKFKPYDNNIYDVY